MANSIVHFEIIGTDPTKLRAYYADLFDWQSDTSSIVAPEISKSGEYGFIDSLNANNSVGIPGGIGGGDSFTPQTIFYVGVPDVETALLRAEGLGGRRLLGPISKPDNSLVVGHFADPEGNVIGVAGPK